MQSWVLSGGGDVGCAGGAAVASVGLRLAHATHRQRPDSATPSPRCRHPAGVPGAGQGARGRRHRRVQPRHQFRRRWLQLAARRHPAPCHPRLLLPGSRWLCARRATLVCTPQRQVQQRVHACALAQAQASAAARACSQRGLPLPLKLPRMPEHCRCTPIALASLWGTTLRVCPACPSGYHTRQLVLLFCDCGSPAPDL